MQCLNGANPYAEGLESMESAWFIYDTSWLADAGNVHFRQFCAFQEQFHSFLVPESCIDLSFEPPQNSVLEDKQLCVQDITCCSPFAGRAFVDIHPWDLHFDEWIGIRFETHPFRFDHAADRHHSLVHHCSGIPAPDQHGALWPDVEL